MARSSKLKVFRTPIGFHDAYVAAASQKAALKAWGSDRDLFARGVADVVTDSALIAEPLSKPGVVIRRLRGTAAEQIAALPKDSPPTRRKESEQAAPPKLRLKPEAKPRAKPKPQPVPPPDRTLLNQAEKALTEAESRQRAEDRALREREALIARERRELDKSHAAEIRRLDQARDREETTYRRAVQKWRG